MGENRNGLRLFAEAEVRRRRRVRESRESARRLPAAARLPGPIHPAALHQTSTVLC